MTRGNLLSFSLVAALAASALLGCWSSYMWLQGAREAQTLESQYQMMNNVSVAMQSLVSEAIEYSRRNPSIDPILIEYNIKPRPLEPGQPASGGPRSSPRP